MHVRLHLLHYFHRAGGARHQTGAQRGEVVAQEIRVLELRDEHGWNAVQRGATLGLNGLKRRNRIKGLRRKDGGSALGNTHQCAQHHAKAVIQGHRYTKLVVGRELHT